MGLQFRLLILTVFELGYVCVLSLFESVLFLFMFLLLFRSLWMNFLLLLFFLLNLNGFGLGRLLLRFWLLLLL